MTPPDPLVGNAYAQKLPQLPSTWLEAIAAFDKGELSRRIFNPHLVDNLLRTKRQEQTEYAKLSPAEQMELYLDQV